MTLGVSPTAAPSIGFIARSFVASVSHSETWTVLSVSLPCVLLVYLHMNVVPLVHQLPPHLPSPPVSVSHPWYASCHLAAHHPCPDCESLSLLSVWMNVSSLTPWLSDFHTVESGSTSGGLLFSIGCYPSFPLQGSNTVSYTSSLAGTHKLTFSSETIVSGPRAILLCSTKRKTQIISHT